MHLVGCLYYWFLVTENTEIKLRFTVPPFNMVTLISFVTAYVFVDHRKTTDLITCYSTQLNSPFRVQKFFYFQEVLISIPVLQSVNLSDASLGVFRKIAKSDY